MKIFKFVEVATQSHRHEETGGFFNVLRGDRGHLREEKASGVSRSPRSHSFRPYRSFGAIAYTLRKLVMPEMTRERDYVRCVTKGKTGFTFWLNVL